MSLSTVNTHTSFSTNNETRKRSRDNTSFSSIESTDIEREEEEQQREKRARQMASKGGNVRLLKEWNNIQKGKGTDSGWSAGPVNDSNLNVWEGFLFGPEKSPFEGGSFRIRIEFPQNYPFKPPRVVFLTVPYHPNVYTNGNICLDILSDQWTPALQIDQLMQSIRSLLTDPNPNSPANPEAASMYSRNREGYDAKVRDMIAKNGDRQSSSSATNAGSNSTGGGSSSSNNNTSTSMAATSSRAQGATRPASSSRNV